MSEISKIMGAYKDALDNSQNRYENLYHERAENAIKFHNDFFKKLIKPYKTLVEDPAGRRRSMRLIERIFGTNEIKFAAVDGTMYKDILEDYMVFFGASYAVRGDISFRGDPPIIKYQRWTSEQDVSMVAYVPVPFAELGDILTEQFVLSADHEKINLTNIHTQIMQLAEVFLLYDLASNATIRPNILLWDQSMSGVMASTEVGRESIGLIGYSFMGKSLSLQDVIVAYSRPYNLEIGVPSCKEFRFFNYILARLFSKKREKISEISKETGLSEEYIVKKIKPSLFGNEEERLVHYNESTKELAFNERYSESWEYSKGLFRHICDKLFKEKDPSSLTYMKKDSEGNLKTTWMSPNDLDFLVAIGIRALIEICWKYKIMLIGIVKDSMSRHLSRNYLGVMRKLGKYSFANIFLPWTDRTFLEAIPYGDEELVAPWSTVEFDSVFMTLHTEEVTQQNGSTSIEIKGVRGDVLTTERLFARSLAQFFLLRAKPSPLMGHVIFIDRLIVPGFDNEKWEEIPIENAYVGKVRPFVFEDNEKENLGQDASMFLLHTLTRNLFPEVIGYPDPLHKADWGAKSLQDKVANMIKSSNVAILSRPLHRRLRDLRDRIRRV
jgi:hypothetical protein